MSRQKMWVSPWSLSARPRWAKGATLILVTGMLLLWLFSGVFVQQSHASPEDPCRTEISSGFQYRWGDPDDLSGDLSQWLFGDSVQAQWRPYDPHRPPANVNDDHFIWLKRRWPEFRRGEDVIFIPSLGAHQVFEAFVDTALIYKSGEMKTSFENRFLSKRWYIIPLPQVLGDNHLVFRFYSDDPGRIGLRSSIFLGPQGEFYKQLAEKELDRVVLGFLFIFIGLVATVMYFKHGREKAYLLLSLGILALNVGLYNIADTDMKQLFLDQPVFWWYLFHLSLFIFPVGLWTFFDYTYASAYRSLIRPLVLAHVILAGGALVLDLLNVVGMDAARYPFILLIVPGAIIASVALVKAIARGDREAKILGLATIFPVLAGFHDILGRLQIITLRRPLFQYGLFVFILIVSFILERRFVEAHKRLRQYSKELEEKSRDLEQSKEKLEEYSAGLEQKVAERTHALRDRNEELKATLEQLTKTQSQLIQAEKMAAIGNLAAGIAHEVNSPMGAVHSAADVQARCITKLNEMLEKSKTIDDIKGNPEFEKLFAMLSENSQLTITASERISKIIKSLRNFARLDEAEFQKADIHDGIDSTLTLVHHELKNKVEVVKEYGQIPEINCYPNQLNQVFMNLFVNAAHAIEENGVLKIRTYKDNQKVYVEISDTGRGIPPENLEKIFDPGFTTKRRGEGTGLGLSISRKIIEKHDGEIFVKSEVGKGTTFTVVLPIG
jgi:signal transduction histidine kinase